LPDLAKSILTDDHHLSKNTKLGDKKSTALSMDFSGSQILISPMILSRRGSMLELDKYAVHIDKREWVFNSMNIEFT
jgi:hypothetical protein